MLPREWLKPVLLHPGRKPGEATNDDDNDDDDDEVILQSYTELARKNHATLYGDQANNDKSPKGSVDAPIQHLVDLINHHHAICTLSSCSGRISLFDPNRLATSDEHTPDSEDATVAPFTEGSGKGCGRWLVVSHDLLDPDEVVQAIFSKENTSSESEVNDEEPWMLKLEPMLLHVAARSLKMGQNLLQIALACGFRESGLVVTPKRVTVAIRSHSLALGIPLLPHHALCPSSSYIRSLVKLYNQRLQQNWDQMQRLYDAIEAELFEIALRPKIQVLSKLPPLRLWSAGTAVVTHEGKKSVITFGGYGKGPDPRSTSSKRTASIYRLDVDAADSYKEKSWKQVEIASTDDGLQECWKRMKGITPLRELPHACQGMVAASLLDWIVLWGGRTSPGKALGDMYLFHAVSNQLARVDVGGTNIPCARWGHTFQPISGNRIVLMGGSACGEPASDKQSMGPSPVFEDIYILHYIEEQGLMWEQVENVRLAGGKMHAGSTVLSATQHPNVRSEEILLVTGGLGPNDSQRNPLLLFQNKDHGVSNGAMTWSCAIGCTTYDMQGDGSIVPKTKASIVDCPVEEISVGFGCSIGKLDNGPLALVSGGVYCGEETNRWDDESSFSLQCFIVRNYQASWESKARNSRLPLSIEGDLDLSCLVHHACLPVGDSELLLVGGGSTSFAFGDTFAHSYHLRFDTRHSYDKISTGMSRTDFLSVDMPDDREGKHATSVSTHVVYVAPQDAKKVKTFLEEKGWLDKGFRMKPIEGEPKRIAIPIRRARLEELSTSLIDGVSLEIGSEKGMPLSTKRFATQSQQRERRT